MPEERLKVESGPPQHMREDAAADGPADGAKERVQEAAGQAKEQVQSAAGPVKEKARAVAGEAKGHARSAVGQAQAKAVEQVDERSTQAGARIASQAETLDGVAGELRKHGHEGPAKLAERTAEKVKGIGEQLEQADGESLVTAVKEAAQEHPGAAAAVGAVAGFAAGRVIKASQGDADAEPETPSAPAGGG